MVKREKGVEVGRACFDCAIGWLARGRDRGVTALEWTSRTLN